MSSSFRRAACLALAAATLLGAGLSAGSPSVAAARGPTVHTVAAGLRISWGVAFLPDGTALVTERGNDVVVGKDVNDRSLTTARRGSCPLTVTGESARSTGCRRHANRATVECGHCTSGSTCTTETDNRIARLRLGQPQPPEPILTGIPIAVDPNDGIGRYHLGGRLAFGPDGMLYASTGETFDNRERRAGPQLARREDPAHHAAGPPRTGQPVPHSPVWSFGHRNVQGLAWDARGRMYASELGEDAYDELNLIRPGGNYGWPIVEGAGDDPRFVNPIATWTPTSIASPGGIAVARGRVYVACLAGEILYRVGLDGRQDGALLAREYGRLRDVTRAPDGSLWVLTSNRDGRGPATAHDDRILRVTL
jgi:glucose/arabinose dehydrogenase